MKENAEEIGGLTDGDNSLEAVAQRRDAFIAGHKAFVWFMDYHNRHFTKWYNKADRAWMESDAVLFANDQRPKYKWRVPLFWFTLPLNEVDIRYEKQKELDDRRLEELKERLKALYGEKRWLEKEIRNLVADFDVMALIPDIGEAQTNLC